MPGDPPAPAAVAVVDVAQFAADLEPNPAAVASSSLHDVRCYVDWSCNPELGDEVDSVGEFAPGKLV